MRFAIDIMDDNNRRMLIHRRVCGMVICYTDSGYNRIRRRNDRQRTQAR